MLTPEPLFDNIANLNLCEERASTTTHPKDFKIAIAFLKAYTGSEGTFNSYRREIERLLHWTWTIAKKELKTLNRQDIENFIRFCQRPHKHWIGTKNVSRFLLKEGIRVPNKEWRPFVISVSKAKFKRGERPEIEKFELSPEAIKELMAIVSSFFNYCLQEEFVDINPVALIRQKSKFIRKHQSKQTIRALNNRQWQYLLASAETLANKYPEKHERTLFMLSCLYGMYLRISELTASERWTPTMNDFQQDRNEHWWFTTVGKGNKERQIAVSDAMLASLKRWREHLNLTPLPSPDDNTPLFPKIKGSGPMSDPSPIRRLIQTCFDIAEEKLRKDGHSIDADSISHATVHWLRHTGISVDINQRARPLAHVRDDAGHASIATTDRYNDSIEQERHATAKDKPIG